MSRMPSTRISTGRPRTSVRAGARAPSRGVDTPRAIRPGWRHERALWRDGFEAVAGVDEVGRGPLAGPVVAAAVILPRRTSGDPSRSGWIAELRDSKVLTPQQRTRLAECIQKHAICAVSGVSTQVVDQINILQATRLAMKRAVAALPTTPDALIIDGREVVEGGLHQIAVVDGDALCASVAAASILAKVTRDRLMCDLDRRFPGYGLAVNKGYATAEHRAALAQLGYTSIHRLSFAPVREVIGGATGKRFDRD